MSTRAEIQAKIDADLASSQPGGITAAQHRGVLGLGTNTVLSELYKTSSILETQNTSNIMTYSGVDWEYTLRFKKQGGIVYVQGTITNTSTTGRGNIGIADFNNAEYTPSNDCVILTDRGNSSGGNPPDFVELSTIKVTASGEFRVEGIIYGTNTGINTVNINGFYFVNN
jgi:hypothetical protein